jgi:hypothetical protein
MDRQDVEEGLVTLIATDRIEIPISSMSGKLKRQKKPIAQEVAEGFNVRFDGERAYARVEEQNKMKARTMKEGIEEFEKRYPKYGQILRELIAEERSFKETHMHFGMYEGCRVSAADYRDVMANLGFTPGEAEQLYPRLMDISRKLSKKRVEDERTIMIG